MKSKRVSSLGLFATVGLTALMLPSVALAQTALPADPDEESQVDTDEADSDDSWLQMIVVTAERRGVNLQRVPIAVSAVQAEELELRGLSEVKDLSAVAPNVSVLPGTTSGSATVVSIRGIPSQADESQGFDSPIGLYLDGVFLARSSAASFEVAEIERVEVLRGPQGTLFGRNTTGGAINFITKKPPSEFGLKVKAGFGNFDSREGKVTLDSGDLGGVRMSLSYLHKERDGVVQNPLEPNDRKDPGGYNIDGARYAVEADIGDNITITNIFDFTNYTGTPLAAQLAAVGDGSIRPNLTFEGNTFVPVQPANVGGFLANATVLEPGCGITVEPERRLDTICLESADTSTDRIYGNMFRVLAEFDKFTLRSTSAYRKWENRIRGSDLDGLGSLSGPLFNIGNPNAPLAFFTGFPASTLTAFGLPGFLAAGNVPTVVQPLFQANNTREQDQFSQEIELISNFGGKFEFVLGGFYFQEDGFETNDQSFGFVLDTNRAVFNAPALRQVLLGFGFPAATATALAPQVAAAFQANNPAPQRIIPQLSTLTYTAAGKSYAVYGQGSYRPGGPDGALGFTLGLRYTRDEKEFTRTQNGPVPFTSPVDIANNDQRETFSSPTGNFTIDYRASDDLNLYARIARGYRSGGFNARQSTNDRFGNPTIPLTPFNEEQIISYELGAKAEFADRVRLNVALFYNNYDDQLASIPVPIVGSGSFGTITVNAGKTTYTGAEVEGTFAVTDNLTLDGNFGYVDAKVKEFPGVDINGVTQNIAGLTDASYAPEYTGNVSATYRQEVGFADLVARVGYNYISSFEMFPNQITAPFSEETRGDARGLVDAQISLQEIALGGSLLTITAWGKNLTDEGYIARAVDFGQLGFAHTLYGEPRTYGLSATVEF